MRLSLHEGDVPQLCDSACLCLGAAAVNYKDIMLATGKLQREADANSGALGFEWAGRVRTACLTAVVNSSAACAPSIRPLSYMVYSPGLSACTTPRIFPVIQ